MAEHPFLHHLPCAPQVALVLGSGLGPFADTFDDRTSVSYKDVEGMPQSAVEGHAGNFVFGRVAGVPVLAMQGRVHLYEGFTPAQVVFGLRTMIDAGAKAAIITNAAGGIRADLHRASLMLIRDHINLTGMNCLLGPNDDAVGPRFPDMSEAYSADLRAIALEVANREGILLSEGVYAGLLGPTYETPAEIRMLATVGADAVGMSTVQEVIAARHRGVPCLGISCITNAAAGLGEARLDHADVQRAAAEKHEEFARLLRGTIAQLGAQA